MATHDLFEATEKEVKVIFARGTQEILVQELAEHAGLSEEESWLKISDFILGLLEQDVETELADLVTDGFGADYVDSKSLFSWAHEKDALQDIFSSRDSNSDSLVFKLPRAYFDEVLSRKLTNEEWEELVEEFRQAIQHDNEIDLHYADLDEFLQ